MFLTFPTAYTLTTSMSIIAQIDGGGPIGCIYTIAGSTVTITNVYPRKTPVNNVTLTIQFVMNPIPSQMTTCFTGVIDTDTSFNNIATTLSSCKTVLSASTFILCKYTFNSRFVCSTAAMVF